MCARGAREALLPAVAFAARAVGKGEHHALARTGAQLGEQPVDVVVGNLGEPRPRAQLAHRLCARCAGHGRRELGRAGGARRPRTPPLAVAIARVLARARQEPVRVGIGLERVPERSHRIRLIGVVVRERAPGLGVQRREVDQARVRADRLVVARVPGGVERTPQPRHGARASVQPAFALALRPRERPVREHPLAVDQHHRGVARLDAAVAAAAELGVEQETGVDPVDLIDVVVDRSARA